MVYGVERPIKGQDRRRESKLRTSEFGKLNKSQYLTPKTRTRVEIKKAQYGLEGWFSG